MKINYSFYPQGMSINNIKIGINARSWDISYHYEK